MSSHFLGQDISVAARCHDIVLGLNGWGENLFAEILRCGRAARVILLLEGRTRMGQVDFRAWAMKALSLSETDVTETTQFLVEVGTAAIQGDEIAFRDDSPRAAFARIGAGLKELELGEYEYATLRILEEIAKGPTPKDVLYKFGDEKFIDEAASIGVSAGFIRRQRQGKVVTLSLKCPTEISTALRAPTLLVG